MANLSELRENAVPELSFDTQVFAISPNMTLTYSHGFADVPRFVWLVLRCVAPQMGWVVGDEIIYDPLCFGGASTGATIALNKTEVKLVVVGTPIIFSTLGVATEIAPVNWVLEVRLER